MLLVLTAALAGMLHGPFIVRTGSFASRAISPHMEKTFTALELKAAGFPASKLKTAGFTAEQMKEAGYTATELMCDAQFDISVLKELGYGEVEIQEAGLAEMMLSGDLAPKRPEDLLSESERRRQQPKKNLWRPAPEGRRVRGEERGWGERDPTSRGQ